MKKALPTRTEQHGVITLPQIPRRSAQPPLHHVVQTENRLWVPVCPAPPTRAEDGQGPQHQALGQQARSEVRERVRG